MIDEASPSFLTLVGQADGWDHMGWDDGSWIVMWIGMILFWGLVVAGILWLVREVSGHARRETQPDPAEILDRRLAEGQISVEEYEQRRRILRGE